MLDSGKPIGQPLALPETSETNSWNHPNFRAGKRTFVTFERLKGESSFAFRLPKKDIERLLRQERFFATPYGRGQWVSLRVGPDLDWQLVEELVIDAFRGVALQRMLSKLDGPDAQP